MFRSIDDRGSRFALLLESAFLFDRRFSTGCWQISMFSRSARVPWWGQEVLSINGVEVPSSLGLEIELSSTKLGPTGFWRTPDFDLPRRGSCVSEYWEATCATVGVACSSRDDEVVSELILCWLAESSGWFFTLSTVNPAWLFCEFGGDEDSESVIRPHCSWILLSWVASNGELLAAEQGLSEIDKDGSSKFLWPSSLPTLSTHVG